MLSRFSQTGKLFADPLADGPSEGSSYLQPITGESI